MSGLAGQLLKQAGLYEYDKTRSGRASRWADYKIALTKNKIKQANVKRKIAKIENKLLKDYEMAFNNVSASSELQAHLNNVRANAFTEAVKATKNKFTEGWKHGKASLLNKNLQKAGADTSEAGLAKSAKIQEQLRNIGPITNPEGWAGNIGSHISKNRNKYMAGGAGIGVGGAGYYGYNKLASSENTVTAGLGEVVKKATSAGWNFVKNNKKKTAGILSAGGAAGFAAGRVTASDEMNDIRAFSLASVKNTLKSIGNKVADSAVGQHFAKNGKKYSAIGGAAGGVLGTFGLQKVTSSETAEVADDGKVAAVKEFIAEKYQDATLDKPILEGEGQEVTAMQVFSSITAAEYLDIKTGNQAGFSVSAADAKYLNSISAMEYLILSNEDTAALTQAVDAANELAETAETPEEVEEAIIRQEEAAQANAEAAQVYSEAASNNHNPDADEHAALAEFHADKAAEAQNNSDVLASWYYDNFSK